MIFKRRERPPFWDRMREIMLPRKGWWRPFGYAHKRMRRLPDSPENIALGFACGAFVSFTPFFFFHLLFAAGLGWLMGGNIIAALLGTIVGNPITFPLIAAVALKLGWWILGVEEVEPADSFTFSWLWDNLELIFLPYLVGGLLPGLVVAVISFYVCRPVVAAYQKRRREKLAAKAAKRRALADAEAAAYEMHDTEGDNA